MRPSLAPCVGEIIRIRDARAHRRLGLEYLVGNAMTLAISDRLVLGVEAELHFLLHVAGAGPAHQRLDCGRLLRLVIEHPLFGVGMTGLHRRAGRFVDAGSHGEQSPKASAGHPPTTDFWRACHAVAKAKAGGRGSRIRTCDLQYPKLPRYQAALYPAGMILSKTVSALSNCPGPSPNGPLDTCFAGLRQGAPPARQTSKQLPRPTAFALAP